MKIKNEIKKEKQNEIKKEKPLKQENIKQEKLTKIKKEKKSLFKKGIKKEEIQKPNNQVQGFKSQEFKKPHVSKRQFRKDDKKSKLAKAARQTYWAPVWAVMKKYGTGKKIHPSAMTAYKRSWRRTKLHIKPRKINKWHMG